MKVDQSTISAGNTAALKKTQDKVTLTSKNAKAANTSNAIGDSVKVSISDRAHEIAKAKDIAMATSDVRADKVRELKEKIQSGKYKVDASAVADRMVNEALEEA